MSATEPYRPNWSHFYYAPRLNFKAFCRLSSLMVTFSYKPEKMSETFPNLRKFNLYIQKASFLAIFHNKIFSGKVMSCMINAGEVVYL